MANIMLTSISRKISLLDLFKTICEELGHSLIVADLDDNCLAKHTDQNIFKRQKKSGLAGVLELVREHHIDLVVPTRDADCLSFTEAHDDFLDLGCKVLSPPHDVVSLCLNKEKLNVFLLRNDLNPVPELNKITKEDFPIFIRPKKGQGSIGCVKIESQSLFRPQKYPANKYFFHPYIKDKEYSVDVVTDHKQKYFSCVIRERISLFNGESQVTETCHIPELEVSVKKLFHNLKTTGHFVAQAFYSKENGVRFIEINPRFGGASILSQHAGLNSIKYLTNEALGGDTKKYRSCLRKHEKIRMIRKPHDEFEVL